MNVLMKNKLKSNSNKKSEKKSYGTETPAPVDHEDPTGSKGNISMPKSSGYDEKQPASKK
jgi:hypothetical protein